MMYTNTTPVPNALFDLHLKDLSTAELKILLVIIRQTLGWSDSRTAFGRKEKDWISNGQLQLKTGCSRRSISSATGILVQKDLIQVLDQSENLLSSPSERIGKRRLFYRLNPTLTISVERVGKSSRYSSEISLSCAKSEHEISKKVTMLAQNMRITKETIQN
jgi:hypothetical protein